MENEELNKSEDIILKNLSKNELFEKIKSNCKSKAKRNLLYGAFSLLLCILFLCSYNSLGSKTSIIVFILLIIESFSCLGGYLKNKKMGDFVNPKKMINWYDNKYDKSNRIVENIFIILAILLIGYFLYYVIINTDINRSVLLLIALGVMFVYFLLYGLSKNRNIDSSDIKKLRKLIENE